MSQNSTDDEEWSLRQITSRARSMTASPLLYIGAITVVVANEIIEWLVEWYLLPEFYGALALFPIVLALLYGQLAVLAVYERKGYQRRCGAR